MSAAGKVSRTDLQGTCGACFQTVALMGATAGPVVGRHGWREQGARRVGQTGNAWHVGECFGVGRAPFEISKDATIAFLGLVVVPHLDAAVAELARLKSRPVIYDTRSVGPARYLRAPSRDRLGMRFFFTVRIAPGDARWNAYAVGVDAPGVDQTLLMYSPGGDTLCTYVESYEEALAAKRADAEHELDGVRHHVRMLTDKLDAWQPAELAKREVKGPTIHYKRASAELAVCTSRRSASAWSLRTTDMLESVTCTKCRKAMRLA